MHCNRRLVECEILESRRLMSADLIMLGPSDLPIISPIVYFPPQPPPILTTIIVTSRKPAIFTDAGGNKVSVRMSGPGTALLGFSATGNADVQDVTVSGTTLGSSLTITPLNHERTDITGNISISSALGKFIAPRVDLATDASLANPNLLVADAAVGTLAIGNVTGNGTEDITVGGSPKTPLHFKGGSLAQANFSSDFAVASIDVASWSVLGGDLFAPSIGELKCAGNFSAGVSLYGHGVMKDAVIGGTVGAASWVIGGNVDRLQIGDIPAYFNGTIGGRLDSLVVNHDDAGTIAAGHFGDIFIGGNLTGGKLLAGVFLGSSGTTDGNENSQATYASGSIDALQVGGSVTDSIITAGFKPTDGLFDNSQGSEIGGSASHIHNIDIVHGIDTGTQFVAGAFGTAQIPGSVNPAKDRHFIVP